MYVRELPEAFSNPYNERMLDLQKKTDEQNSREGMLKITEIFHSLQGEARTCWAKTNRIYPPHRLPVTLPLTATANMPSYGGYWMSL